jgi:hypothetical protein
MGKKAPGEMWLRLFLKRHPDISVFTSRGLAAARYDALSANVMKTFFDNQQVASLGLDSRRICIMDETAASTSLFYEACCRIYVLTLRTMNIHS